MDLEGGEMSGLHLFGPRVMCCSTRMVRGYMMYTGVRKAFVVPMSCMIALRAVRNRHHRDRNGSVFSFFIYTYFGKEPRCCMRDCQ